MTSADSREPVPTEAARSSLSSTGQATFDLALRMGGLFLAIVLVALLMLVLKPNFVQRRCRHIGASRDELGRDHVARADARHRGRRDRSLVRRDVRPRRQFARRDVDSAGRSDLRRAAARDRRRRAGRPVQRRSRHLAQHSLVHRDARQLQSALWRFAVDHQYLDLQPGLSAARASRSPHGRA